MLRDLEGDELRAVNARLRHDVRRYHAWATGGKRTAGAAAAADANASARPAAGNEAARSHVAAGVATRRCQ